MALLNRLSIAATTCAAFLSVGTFGIAPAQAALFKFSFASDEANGYFIYDTSVPPTPNSETIFDSDVPYFGATTEYKVDLGENGIFQGTTGNAIVLSLNKPQNLGGFEAPEGDYFTLEARGNQRQPQSKYTFLTTFVYPRGSFGGSTALPTTVPISAFTTVFPDTDFPNTLGKAAFVGTTQTKIEAVPESTSGLALLGVGVGALFILRRRHSKQTLLY